MWSRVHHPIPIPFILFLFLFVFLSITIPVASALRVELKGKRASQCITSTDFNTTTTTTFNTTTTPAAGYRKRRRRSLIGAAVLTNSDDVSYYVDLTLGGRTFEAMIDSGSSDLWVSGIVPSAVQVGGNVGVQYAVGEASGPIKSAPLEFAGYTIPQQAFIEVDPSNDTTVPSGAGIIGLGPSQGSIVLGGVTQQHKGYTVLDNIFALNASLPTYTTVLLGRSVDPGTSQPFPGELTVGEILPGYEDILQQPRLGITDVRPEGKEGAQHIQVLLDRDGIKGPDGTWLRTRSAVAGGAAGEEDRYTVIFDTGFSLPQVPSEIAQALYSHFPSSSLVYIDSLGSKAWVLPCTQEVNITFSFGGVDIPVHPLDATLTREQLGIVSLPGWEEGGRGREGCVGAFQPFSFSRSSTVTYDAILGMSFRTSFPRFLPPPSPHSSYPFSPVRNTYLLTNYGKFVLNNSSSTSSSNNTPFVQLLPTTNNSALAHSEFVRVRLGGVDTTVPVQPGSFPSDDSSSSDGRAAAAKRKAGIVVGAVLGGVVLLLLGVWVVVVCWGRGRGWGGVRKPDPLAPQFRGWSTTGTGTSTGTSTVSSSGGGTTTQDSATPGVSVGGGTRPDTPISSISTTRVLPVTEMVSSDLRFLALPLALPRV